MALRALICERDALRSMVGKAKYVIATGGTSWFTNCDLETSVVHVRTNTMTTYLHFVSDLRTSRDQLAGIDGVANTVMAWSRRRGQAVQS